jgi:DNA polymerase
MNTYEILKTAGFPADFVVLDFETYFDDDYTLYNMTHWEYITDDRFEPIGCGFKFSNVHGTCYMKPDPFFCWAEDLYEYFEKMQEVYGQNFEDITVVVQNAHFDILLLLKEYEIDPKFVIDCKHLDSHFDSRRSHKLKDMAKRAKLEPKGDTMQFSGVHLDDMTAEQREAMETYCKLDCRLEYDVFEDLLPYLSDPAVSLNHAMHTTALYTKPKLSFDFGLADELTLSMTKHIDEACKSVGMSKEDISGNLSFVTALQSVLPEGEMVPTKAHKRPGKKMTALLGQSGIGPALAKTDDGCLMLLAHSKKEVGDLMKARQAVKSWPLHVKRIASMKQLATSASGRMPVPLNYYGCHTGRPSGGGGINLLNLGGSGRAGMGTHPLIRKMRNLLTAKTGMLVISDAAQIECRLLAWIAGQEDLVQAFADDRDVYSEFGSVVFSARLRKPRDTDPPAMKTLLTIRRGFSKDTVLGAGYGMGENRFYNNCLMNPSLRPLFDSGKYDRAFVSMLIKGYRKTYYRIPEFWKSVEQCFRLVTKYPHEVRRYAVPGTKLGENDLLTFWNQNGTVCIQLPSGRILYYPHAAVKKGDNDWGDQIRYHHGPLWGGSITENIIQAIAFDMLIYWIDKCEAAGIPIVHHVYDEVIGMSTEFGAEADLKVLMEIMSEGPEWAAGCPFAAEGETSKTYKK